MVAAAVRSSPLILALWVAACGPPVTAAPAPRAPDPADPAAPAAPEARAPQPPSATPELDAITLPPRPAWTDKYFEAGPDQRRFEITLVMQRYGLTRAQAIEAQNHYRDLARAEPNTDLDALLAEAVTRAKAGRFEDRRDLEKLERAPFIVVFDLDDTLIDQYMPEGVGATCKDLDVVDAKGTRPVKLTPGWERAVRRIVELGGAVVLFSANTDDRTWGVGRAWMLGDEPIVQSELVSGFLTNSHLIQQHTREGDPVQEPSKDLRAFDESLRRAIIVDDNPKRIVQPANLRLFKKFHAEEYCGAADPAVRKAYAEALPRVVWEIEDSVRWMKAHPGTDFITAYRPFTALGQVATTFVQNTMGLSRQRAVDWLRRHPDFVDDDF